MWQVQLSISFQLERGFLQRRETCGIVAAKRKQPVVTASGNYIIRQMHLMCSLLYRRTRSATERAHHGSLCTVQDWPGCHAVVVFVVVCLVCVDLSPCMFDYVALWLHATQARDTDPHSHAAHTHTHTSRKRKTTNLTVEGKMCYDFNTAHFLCCTLSERTSIVVTTFDFSFPIRVSH